MNAMVPPCTANPVRACGVTGPSSVPNTMSTTASSGKGLKRNRPSLASLVVTPSAKYHWADAVDAQGATVSPMGPLSASSTTASPPSSSTTADANTAGATSARWTVWRPAGATAIGVGTGWPWYG